LAAKSNPIKVLIADGHAPYSKALKTTLEMEDDIEIIGEVDDWHPLEQATRILHPDIILVDIRLHDAEGICDGISATRQILHRHPHPAVIVLTMLPSKELALQAQQAGARALISKDDHNYMLLQLIRSIMQDAIPAVGALQSTDSGQYRAEY
jgi:two-component system nitrate/nitrite response regulator NarL